MVFCVPFDQTNIICNNFVSNGSQKKTKNSRRLWRSQKRKSRSIPEGKADFPAKFSLPENVQTLAGIAFCAAGKSVKNFPAASKVAGELFQQGILDSHSLLEFPDLVGWEGP